MKLALFFQNACVLRWSAIFLQVTAQRDAKYILELAWLRNVIIGRWNLFKNKLCYPQLIQKVNSGITLILKG